MRSKNGEYSRRAIIARIHENIDQSWCTQYQSYLDFMGREPRPIDERSLALILAFFLLSWGLATWNGMVHLIPAISLTAIVSLASLRFNDFNRAFQQYTQRRVELAAAAAKTA